MGLFNDLLVGSSVLGDYYDVYKFSCGVMNEIYSVPLAAQSRMGEKHRLALDLCTEGFKFNILERISSLRPLFSQNQQKRLTRH